MCNNRSIGIQCVKIYVTVEVFMERKTCVLGEFYLMSFLLSVYLLCLTIALQERGAVGETILHLCLLNATSLLADLAKRLLRFYPKLINDIYMSDEYYGAYILSIASTASLSPLP